MHNDDFYDKDQMAGNVDRLMNDMTVFTADRRNRDAEMLSMIRDRHTLNTSNSANNEGIFGKVRHILSRKKKEEAVTTAEDSAMYLQKSQIRHTVTAHQEYAVYPKDDYYDWDDKTIVEEELADDDDATVVDEELADDNDATAILDDAIEDDEATDLFEESGPVAVIVFAIDGKEQRRVISEGITTIGSLADQNDIAIEGRYVSRRHAAIVCRGGYIYISDMGSKNGTYINGSKERLTENTEYRVNPGDVITLADKELFIYEYGGTYDRI